ncbi:hypothetical protein C4J81_06915 [Deltaproteobacteria bacterium Smac51]|nr:hypothetical protein C4J81_06915 [Deltaproteobacteria bacterium Smac51]
MAENDKTLDGIMAEIWREDKASVYMVLDAAMNSEWPGQLWRVGRGKPEAVCLLQDAAGPEHLPAAPFLLPLREPDELCRYLVEACLKLPSGIFLVSDKPRLEVIEEAAAWLWPEVESGQRVYFRYYDPRVFTSLEHYARDNKKPLPAGSFSGAFWHDPFLENIFQLKFEPPGQPFNRREPWRLEPDLEEWLMRSQLPHRIMDMLKNADSKLCGQYSRPDLFRKISSQVMEATDYRILELRDLMRFSHLSLLFPGFTKQPDIQASLIEYGRQGGVKKFNDLVESWPTDCLAPFRREEIL